MIHGYIPRLILAIASYQSAVCVVPVSRAAHPRLGMYTCSTAGEISGPDMII